MPDFLTICCCDCHARCELDGEAGRRLRVFFGLPNDMLDFSARCWRCSQQRLDGPKQPLLLLEAEAPE